MKVLLINPSWPRPGAGRKRFRRRWPPLDLLNAAALLRRRGHEPRLIDARAGDARPIRTEAQWADMVVFQTTPLDRWQCPDLNWRAIGSMTEGLPKDRLILAGTHGTVMPGEVLALSGAAALIRGEPEATLADMADAWPHIGELPGMVVMSRQGPRPGPPPKPVDLDELPPPAYDLIRPEAYGYELLGRRLALLETARGCPYSCGFCLKAMYGPGVRFKSRDRVIGELVAAVTGWGAGCVYFFDLEFTIRREAVMDLCREIIRLKLEVPWTCQTRVDAVDPELLATMKAAGCALIHFGIETGSPRLLEAVGKRADPETAVRAVRWCRETGIDTACFFLVGLPGETDADRRATRHFSRRIGATYASFHPAAPYPGTPLSTGGEVGDMPPCLPEHDIDRLAADVRRAYLNFYLRPAYLLGRLLGGGPAGGLRRARLFWECVR